ncbi:hypothetical protein SLEP1_g42858 [Rubroshorea leprosula]|uniref:Uncharacterized protein n=1 Tax=Rubroshorea leprosula TaxID=152421 RepID=A0AAV5LBE3_9ROSI|nr:hypothetical protein SLEP1_g42858 [Rubroshorea leprosula]
MALCPQCPNSLGFWRKRVSSSNSDMESGQLERWYL